MLRKLKMLFLAGLLGCLAVGCGDKITATEDVFEVIEESFVFDADGGTHEFVLQTTVGWTATTNADWCTVTPAKGDAKPEGVKVRLKATTNASTESRAAIVTIVPDTDILPVINITVTQSGAVKTLCVWNIDEYTAIDNYTANLDYVADTTAICIKSNVDWDIVSAPEWLNIIIPDTKDELTTIKLAYDTNNGAARNGDLILSGDDLTLDIPVFQAATLSFNITNETEGHAYIDADIKVVPEGGLEGATHYWYFTCMSKANLEKRGGAEALVKFYLTAYTTYYIDYDEANLFYDSEETLQYDSLDPDTEYAFIVYGVKRGTDENGSPAFVASTDLNVFEFKTESVPVAESTYTDLAGTYTIDWIDFYSSKVDEETYEIITAVRDTVTLVVEPHYINETYDFYFPEGTVSPTYSTYIDTFVASYDDETHELCFYNGQLGSMGYDWTFKGVDDYCAIAFFTEWWNSKDKVESTNFKLSSDKSQLLLTNTTSDGSKDNIFFQTSVYCNDESLGGYYLGVFDDASIPTRVVEAATPTSVKSGEIKAKNEKILGIKAKTSKTPSLTAPGIAK